MSNQAYALSVVIPVYRSREILPHLQSRLTPVLDSLANSWEVILVDDASGDGTWEVMQRLRQADQRYRLIQLMRNHGQQHALLCGLRHSTGERVVTMDDDLQNPPEEIPNLLRKLDEGYDIVIGRIAGQKQHSGFRNFGSRFVQWLVSRILHKPRHLALSSFRALSGPARDAIAAHDGVNPYFPALMFNSVAADRIVNIDVRHDPRSIGKSTYTLRKLLKLASFLLINHSTLPLRFMVLWGFVVSAGAMVFALYVLIRVLFFADPAAGWPSLAIMISFFSGNILMALGIIGEYVGRTLQELSSTSRVNISRTEF